MNWKALFIPKVKVKLEIVAGCKPVSGKEVTIMKGKEPGTLIFSVPWKSFQQHPVSGIEWEEASKRSVGQAAVGAIAVGLLTGGLGAIAGAAIGGRRQDNSRAVIYLCNQYKLIVRCTPAQYEAITNLL